MTNTNLILNDAVKERNVNEEKMKKSNIICLYHIKVKKQILSLNPWKKTRKTLLLTSIRAKIAFTGSKPSICFQLVDKAKYEHNHDIVYHGNCIETDCHE